MSNRRTFNTLILAAALLIGAGPYVVNAARTAADANTRANIDLHQVFEASEARQVADGKTGLFARKLDQSFAEIGQMPFLTPAEVRDLSIVSARETPTEAETKRAAEVKGEYEKRAAESNTLAQKKEADLTAADKTRVRELNNMRQGHAQAMLKVQQMYQQAVNEENVKNERAGMAAIRGLVAKIAKEKGIAEVFDASVLVVAPVDLTKDAVERAKKK